MDTGSFRVGITRDCLTPGGETIFDPAAFDVLGAVPGLEWEILPEDRDELTAADADRYDAICVLMPRVTARTVQGRRLKLIARLGVGYDTVEVPALTEAGVILTIAPDGVRRPVATAALTFVLALAQKMLIKDRLTRAGRWAERTNHLGTGLTGRVLGSIGVGNIGAELFRLAKPLQMQHIAHDPNLRPEDVAELGVTLVDLDTVLREADFVCINCPLSEATRGLIGARELGLMKPSAYLINTARGPIVDERALYAALSENRIAGAGLDVFDQEPTPPDNPILTLDNVIVTPHSICFTDECLRRLAESAFGAAVAVARGQQPAHMVNPDVLGRSRMRESPRH
jgi:phosphoglycerate dehydrogenase-like enzyme